MTSLNALIASRTSTSAVAAGRVWLARSCVILTVVTCIKLVLAAARYVGFHLQLPLLKSFSAANANNQSLVLNSKLWDKFGTRHASLAIAATLIYRRSFWASRTSLIASLASEHWPRHVLASLKWIIMDTKSLLNDNQRWPSNQATRASTEEDIVVATAPVMVVEAWADLTLRISTTLPAVLTRLGMTPSVKAKIWIEVSRARWWHARANLFSRVLSLLGHNHRHRVHRAVGQTAAQRLLQLRQLWGQARSR